MSSRVSLDTANISTPSTIRSASVDTMSPWPSDATDQRTSGTGRNIRNRNGSVDPVGTAVDGERSPQCGRHRTRDDDPIGDRHRGHLEEAAGRREWHPNPG